MDRHGTFANVDPKRQLYLDTSVIRRCGSRLPDELAQMRGPYPDLVPATSVLTLIELVSGLLDSEQAYRRRRSSLLGLRKADVKTCWQRFEERVILSFDTIAERVDESTDDWAPAIEAVVTHACEQPDKRSFEIAIGRDGLAETLANICKYDNYWASALRDATVDGNREIHQALADPPEHDRDQLRSFGVHVDGNFAATIDSLAERGLTYSAGVLGLALLAFKICGVQRPAERDLRGAYESYNGYAETFLLALTAKCDRMLAAMNNPGRNDAFDLMHFAYIGPHDVLATADVDMARTARAVGLAVQDARRA